MKKGIVNWVLSWLILCLTWAFPAGSLAGSVMIIKGSALIEDKLDGLVTLPGGLVVSSMEIELASWGLGYGQEDVLVYDPTMGICSVYEDTLILNLPDPDQSLMSFDGKTGTLNDFLEDELFVVYDTDLGMIGSMDRFAAAAPYPPPPPSPSPPPPPAPADTRPPNTFITAGPSGVITEKNVTFSFSGSDNRTTISNLVYACFLDGYDGGWSGYSLMRSRSYNDLPNGSYTFSVRAKDGSHNVDPSPASQSFTVDYPYADAYGDVKEDGNVDLLDAVLALQVCAGMTHEEEINNDADVNNDEKIGLAEVVYILQRVSGMR